MCPPPQFSSRSRPTPSYPKTLTCLPTLAPSRPQPLIWPALVGCSDRTERQVSGHLTSPDARGLQHAKRQDFCNSKAAKNTAKTAVLRTSIRLVSRPSLLLLLFPLLRLPQLHLHVAPLGATLRYSLSAISLIAEHCSEGALLVPAGRPDQIKPPVVESMRLASSRSHLTLASAACCTRQAALVGGRHPQCPVVPRRHFT